MTPRHVHDGDADVDPPGPGRVSVLQTSEATVGLEERTLDIFGRHVRLSVRQGVGPSRDGLAIRSIARGASLRAGGLFIDQPNASFRLRRTRRSEINGRVPGSPRKLAAHNHLVKNGGPSPATSTPGTRSTSPAVASRAVRREQQASVGESSIASMMGRACPRSASPGPRPSSRRTSSGRPERLGRGRAIRRSAGPV